MGSFSWCCKGCGHELCSDELVRLDGDEELYNGYGGSGGYRAIPAWHQRCFEIASDVKKADKTPSKNAPNQGCGPAKLEFVRGYKSDASTVFVARVYHHLLDDDMVRIRNLYLTEHGLEEPDEAGHISNIVQFDDLDKCIEAVETAISKSLKGETCEMFVFGTQQVVFKGLRMHIDGAVYVRQAKFFESEDVVRVTETYRIGEKS
jgi:hypothetical protein